MGCKAKTVIYRARWARRGGCRPGCRAEALQGIVVKVHRVRPTADREPARQVLSVGLAQPLLWMLFPPFQIKDEDRCLCRVTLLLWGSMLVCSGERQGLREIRVTLNIGLEWGILIHLS